MPAGNIVGLLRWVFRHKFDYAMFMLNDFFLNTVASISSYCKYFDILGMIEIIVQLN